MRLATAVRQTLTRLGLGATPPGAEAENGLLRRVSRNFSIGFAGSFIALVVGLLRTAILTKYVLSLEDYGRLLIVLNVFSFVIAFLGVRVHELLYQYWPQFEHAGDRRAQRGLFFLSLAVCTAVGLVGALGVWALAPIMARGLYEDPGLASLLRVYAFAAFTPAFEGIYTGILRLKDRFKDIVVPQVVSSIAMLIAILVYAQAAAEYRLEHVILIFAVGQVLQDLPPLLRAFGSVKDVIASKEGGGLFAGLAPHRKGIRSTLFQSNLTGYLKIITSPGDIFLLGLFASPGQVALYGVAQRLIYPIQMLLTRNLNTTFSPEVALLWAKGRFAQLYAFIRRYTAYAFLIGGGILVMALLLSKPVLLLVTTPEYLDALPAFYILLVSTYLLLVSVVFYSTSVVAGFLHRRNAVFMMGFLPLGVAIAAGLTAATMAAAQLAAVVLMRLFHDIPLMRRLKLRATGAPEAPRPPPKLAEEALSS